MIDAMSDAVSGLLPEDARMVPLLLTMIAAPCLAISRPERKSEGAAD